jgi:glyoxylase-like metal-dependent hydrolase (beta-lactamase superfamily II)
MTASLDAGSLYYTYHVIVTVSRSCCSAGLVAIDAATSPDRVRAAMADLGLTGQAPVSHLILTHAHLDHTGGTEALRGPDTRVIASSRRWPTSGSSAALTQHRASEVAGRAAGVLMRQ